MRLVKKVKIQLLIFAVASLVAVLVIGIGYMRIPSVFFGIGRYTVLLHLPVSGGLYQTGNVSYRGQDVGRIVGVHLTESGVEAVLSLDSDVRIPSDLNAEVHSRSAVGEQYIDLIPRGEGSAAPLRDGDIIPADRASIPPDINSLLNATNRGLQAIPGDSLRTVVDEGYAAVAGLGPDISRLIKGSTTLAIDAQHNLDSLTNLIDESKPLLDTQSDTSDAISAWAAHLADITSQVKTQDSAVRGVLRTGSHAASEVGQLFDRLQPTLPILLANLTSLTDVAVTFHPNIEQLLVLVPEAIAIMDSVLVPNMFSQSQYRGGWVTFALNLNTPPPCLTGYLPPSQQRVPTHEDYPDRPDGDLYCRVPQDSDYNVRGARNAPCETKPGKRAPTVQMCESDEQYVPLNEGYNWKGDPNATTSGQDVPHRPAGSPSAPAASEAGPAPPPVAFAEYDPYTGTYIGADGREYTQTNLAHNGQEKHTWQSMVLPPPES